MLLQLTELFQRLSPSITPRLPKYWRALGENPADSPNGLKLIAARKIGVTRAAERRRAERAGQADARLAAEEGVAVPLRPTAPFSTRTYDSSVNTARRPPPRSSVPRKPRKLLCRPPLSSCCGRLAADRLDARRRRRRSGRRAPTTGRPRRCWPAGRRRRTGQRRSIEPVGTSRLLRQMGTRGRSRAAACRTLFWPRSRLVVGRDRAPSSLPPQSAPLFAAGHGDLRQRRAAHAPADLADPALPLLWRCATCSASPARSSAAASVPAAPARSMSTAQATRSCVLPIAQVAGPARRHDRGARHG